MCKTWCATTLNLPLLQLEPPFPAEVFSVFSFLLVTSVFNLSNERLLSFQTLLLKRKSVKSNAYGQLGQKKSGEEYLGNKSTLHFVPPKSFYLSLCKISLYSVFERNFYIICNAMKNCRISIKIIWNNSISTANNIFLSGFHWFSVNFVFPLRSNNNNKNILKTCPQTVGTFLIVVS